MSTNNWMVKYSVGADVGSSPTLWLGWSPRKTKNQSQQQRVPSDTVRSIRECLDAFRIWRWPVARWIINLHRVNIVSGTGKQNIWSCGASKIPYRYYSMAVVGFNLSTSRVSSQSRLLHQPLWVVEYCLKVRETVGTLTESKSILWRWGNSHWLTTIQSNSGSNIVIVFFRKSLSDIKSKALSQWIEKEFIRLTKSVCPSSSIG